MASTPFYGLSGRGMLEPPQWVNARLDSLTKCPEMWGTPLCVELLYLQALEFALILKGDSEIDINTEWSRVLSGLGFLGNLPLADQTEGYGVLCRSLRNLHDRVLNGRA